MSSYNRVIWSEGLFLQPQHFQQQDRYFERYVETRCQPLTAYSWGFTEIELERDLLSIGKFALRRAAGVFPDGTPFRMPEDDPLPAPIDIDAQVRDQVLFLAVPLRRAGRPGSRARCRGGWPGAARRARVAGARSRGQRRRDGGARSWRAPDAVLAGQRRHAGLRVSAPRACRGVPVRQTGRARRQFHTDGDAQPCREPTGHDHDRAARACSISAAKRWADGWWQPEEEGRRNSPSSSCCRRSIDTSRCSPISRVRVRCTRSSCINSACRRPASSRPSPRFRNGHPHFPGTATIDCASPSSRSSHRCAPR